VWCCFDVAAKAATYNDGAIHSVAPAEINRAGETPALRKGIEALW
jgi:hypothetical protein